MIKKYQKTVLSSWINVRILTRGFSGNCQKRSPDERLSMIRDDFTETTRNRIEKKERKIVGRRAGMAKGKRVEEKRRREIRNWRFDPGNRDEVGFPSHTDS